MVYIYALCCPETNEPRYVGKTKRLDWRLRAHISKARTHQTNHHCAHWIRALLAKGLMPIISVVTELPDGGDWKAAEAAAIRAYRADGYNLTNLTGGGEGFHDCQPDLLIRRGQSRRRTLSIPEKRAEFVTRLNAARSTPIVRQKQSAGVAAAWADPVKRERMLAGMRTPEALSRRADNTRRRMADPAIQQEHTAKVRARFSDPSNRAQLLNAGRKRWRDYRERQAAMNGGA